MFKMGSFYKWFGKTVDNDAEELERAAKELEDERAHVTILRSYIAIKDLKQIVRRHEKDIFMLKSQLAKPGVERRPYHRHSNTKKEVAGKIHLS